MKTFIDCFVKNLRRLILEKPDQYRPYVNDPDLVAWTAAKVMHQLERGTRNFIKDGEAMKATCRELGINNTYTAIERFIANHV